MDQKLIATIVPLLPLQYFETAGLSEEAFSSFRLSELTNLCSADIAFGWYASAAFANARRDLPASITSEPIVKCYAALKTGRISGKLNEAFEVRSACSDQAFRRALYSAFLNRNISLDDIAGAFGYSNKGIWFFHELFFNVRERLDEGKFINSVIDKIRGKDPLFPTIHLISQSKALQPWIRFSHHWRN